MRRVRYWGGNPMDVRPDSQACWVDPWGVTWQKESPDPRMLPFPVGHPLDADLRRLDEVCWPDPDDPAWLADLRHLRPTDDKLLVGEHPFALYERAWLMMGMQPLLQAMVDVPERVDELFERIGRFEAAIARQYVALGVEAAWISDDYGMNSAMMFSPEMWRRFVRPSLERVVKRYHDAGAIVILHSCGNITPLVDEFLALGVDVLDPLQPRCNRLDAIRRKTAGRMCLCGGIESSGLLAGDIDRTREETHERIVQLGADGGYIVGPDDEWEFPADTHEAMLAAVATHRERPGGDRSQAGRPE